MRRTLFCAVLGATGLFAHTANAALMSELAGKTYDPQDPSSYIQVGDKIFTNFNYSTVGDMPSAGYVNVMPQIDTLNGVPNAWGIRIQGIFSDLPGNGGSDALITYTILVNDPNQAISGAHLAANILVVGPGRGTITETFLPDEDPAQFEVYNIAGTSMNLANDTSFLPKSYQAINVQKNIEFNADDPQGGGGFGLVQMSFVDQTFYQVPEPASLGVLGLAGMALVLRRRKA